MGYTTSEIHGEVPLNHLTFYGALFVISIGLLVGLVSLTINKNIRWWLKFLIALTYIPIVMFSMLLSGF